MAPGRGARRVSTALIQVGGERKKESQQRRRRSVVLAEGKGIKDLAHFLPSNLCSDLVPPPEKQKQITPLSQTIDADVVVAGAGAVGLAVARALRLGLGGKGRQRQQPPREVLVLEARPRHGAGVSSRSSEVVHAGLYYEPGSLKAATCVEGARRLWEYCAAKGVRAQRTGKLVVAPPSSPSSSLPASPSPSEALEALAANARRCGVAGLELLSAARARELEPALGASLEGGNGGAAALLSPSSGIFDSHAFLDALAADVEGSGGASSSLYFSSSSSSSSSSLVGGIMMPRAALVGGDLSRSSGGDGKLELLVRTATTMATVANAAFETVRVRANALVVAAGLGTARLLHGDVKGSGVPGLKGWPRPGGLPPRAAFAYAKGNYFALSGSDFCGGAQSLSPFSRLLYPLPDPRGGLGIHATLDLEGRTRFGPDVEWLGEAETRALNGEGGGEGGGGGYAGDDVFGPEPGDVDPSRAALFDAAIRSYWPGLPRSGALRPDYAGVRPKLLPLPAWRKKSDGGGAATPTTTTTAPPSSPTFSDFFVAGARAHGARGVAVVAGIESPGLTASLALADEIVAALFEEEEEE